MHASTDRVMIISNPDDEHTVVVVRHLEEMGINPVLLYPEWFGESLSLSLWLDADSDAWNCHVAWPGESVELSTVSSVWYRRPRLPLLSACLTERSREFARDEWRHALKALYAQSPKALWISRPDRLDLAANKPRQLQLARALGLSVPRTLISSDPQHILDFYRACNERIIAKPTGTGWLPNEDPTDGCYVLTNRVQLQDLMDSPALQLAPVTFQEEIPKEYELRITVVGEAVHAIRIDSQMSSISEIDWRRYDTCNTPYSSCALPQSLADCCREIVRRMGLEYGAIDLIRSSSGQYIFLEMNGNGQFLWAELLTGVPISQSLAGLLARSLPALANQ